VGDAEEGAWVINPAANEQSWRLPAVLSQVKRYPEVLLAMKDYDHKKD
jgi:hypothetical protein